MMMMMMMMMMISSNDLRLRYRGARWTVRSACDRES
jgi:hypothetical protein